MSTVTQLPNTVHPPGDGNREAGDPLSDLPAYDALSEAADLITKAGRLLRRAGQPDLGFHLSDIADEIHTEISRCLPARRAEASTFRARPHRSRPVQLLMSATATATYRLTINDRRDPRLSNGLTLCAEYDFASLDSAAAARAAAPAAGDPGARSLAGGDRRRHP